MDGLGPADTKTEFSRSAGCLFAAAGGIGPGLVVALILLAAWNDCGAGGGVFNELGAALVGGVTTIATGGILGTTVWLRARIRTLGVTILGACLVIVVAYALLAANLASAPSGAFFPNGGYGHCPDRVPAWWPSWLPR